MGFFICQIFVSTLIVHSMAVDITDGLVTVFHGRSLRSYQRPEPKTMFLVFGSSGCNVMRSEQQLWFEHLLWCLLLRLLVSSYIQQIFLIFKFQVPCRLCLKITGLWDQIISPLLTYNHPLIVLMLPQSRYAHLASRTPYHGSNRI